MRWHAAAAGAWSIVASRGGPPLPSLGEVPDFHLTERSGREVSLADLHGHPWVVDFIYTRCTGLCPVLGTRMEELQKDLRGRSDVTLVSVSVDPQYDTPEVLRGYAEKHRADPDRWLFLTGDWNATRLLIHEGFKLGVAQGDPNTLDPGELVTHSDRLVLVDGTGQIRGYYHGTEEESVGKVINDLAKLKRDSG